MKSGCLAIITGAVMTTNAIASGIDLRAGEQDGRKTIEIENAYYKMVLVPEIARLPLTFQFKVTGNDMLVPPGTSPSTVGLSTPNKGFVYYGGLIDSIPWVSGKDSAGNRLAVKGFLYSCAWDCATGRTDNSVWFEGKTSFDYPDPVTQVKTTLAFQKRITGFQDSAMVQMDYLIKNTGKSQARLTFDAHARTAIGGYDAGDYFYAPGRACFLYELVNEPGLSRQGFHIDTWLPWPLKEAMEFNPRPKTSYLMVYLPADWCVIGDEKNRESLFFISSPIKIGNRTDIMKMGIFMTSAAYVVQPCLSYSLQAHPDRWENPGETITLEPGCSASFSLYLAPYQGISRRDMPLIYAVRPESILLTRPELTGKAGGVSLTGKVALSSDGKLRVVCGDQTAREQPVKAGVFDLAALSSIAVPDSAQNLSLIYESAAGATALCTLAIAPAPWKEGWSHRRRLRIDRNQAVETDSTDFPVLVSLQDPALKSSSKGGHVQDEHALDILFTASDGRTALSHEVERYLAEEGELECWVRVPRLSRAEDTLLYMYYGNPAANAQSGSNVVWDADFQAVLHFNDATQPGTDSSVHKNHGQAGSVGKRSSAAKGERGLRFDENSAGIEIPAKAVTGSSGALTLEAWVNASRLVPETIQPIIAQWKLQESFDGFDAYDAGKTGGRDTGGYLGAVFDGRYIYFSPQHNATGRSGLPLRYDTQKPFNAAASWESYDAEKTDGMVIKGFYGAIYDGQYVYYVPRMDGKQFHTRVLRFDTSGDFRDPGFWQAYDLGLGISYQSAAFDGRYIYFCPGTGNVGGHSGLVLRYDTWGEFKEKASWKTHDAGATGGLNTRDFDGAVFDGRYIYFVPLSHSAVLRYDTQGDFEQAASWSAFDALPLGMRRCVGGVFDGHYVYFCAYANNIMVRYDVRQEFTKAAAWQTFDVKQTAGLKHFGYDGGFFDGRYVYFVPFIEDGGGKIMHTEVLRYDVRGPFNDPASWQVNDASRTSGLKTVGYNAGAFDGRYFYFAPWHDGEAYKVNGKIVGHGRVMRYDTAGKQSAFLFKFMDYGHNGGLGGTVCGPTLTLNTENGAVTVRDNRPLAAGWHHLAGVYDGATLKLFVDGAPVDQQAARGRIQNSNLNLMVGRLAGGSVHFDGMIDELRISTTARSDGWIKTAFANQVDPAVFCRSGPEETAPSAGKHSR